MEKNRSYDSKLQALKEKTEKIECLKFTLNSIIYWDKITHMPPKGIEYRSKVMGLLGSEIYSLFSDRSLRELVSFFEKREDNDKLTDAMIQRIKRNYVYVNRIPEKEYREYISLIANAEQVWSSAKAENSFDAFAPYLERIVGAFKNFSEYWGYEDDPYDALIGYYEEGLTTAEIDGMIERIKPEIIKLLKEINNSEVKISDLDSDAVKLNKEKQMKLTKLILEQIGFDFSAGRVDESDHPTVLACSPSDVRLITVFDSNDVRPSIFNALHIGGKGLYEQGIDEGLLGMLLAEVASFGMEEAVARLYEYIIGRNQGFWEFLQGSIRKLLPEYEDINLNDFVKSINRVKAQPIRLDADELTYMLHTIIRYEIERDLINNRISVSDLKQIWNRKYREYLGIEPKSDSEGILQDVQWAAGYFGYFPSYIFATIVSSQVANVMEEELGAMETMLKKGEFDRINGWLRENIYKNGAIYSPLELIRRISNEDLNADYYIKYLWKKYSEVYAI